MAYDFNMEILTRELKDKIQRDFIKKISDHPVVESIDYTFDMPLEGDGWHPRECNNDKYWRFTGPSNVATIYFPSIVATSKKLKLSIFYAPDMDFIDKMSVKIKKILLIKECFKNNMMTLNIPKDALGGLPYTLIEISTPFTVIPNENDDRL